MSSLILLVGGNPLPNYVTARYLNTTPQPPSVIYLVHDTKKYQSQAFTLKKALEDYFRTLPDGQNRVTIEYIQVSDITNKNEISKQIRSKLQQVLGGHHLNYTSGRKTLAVLARESLKESFPNQPLCLSYLDPDRFRLIYEANTPEGNPLDLRQKVQLELDELCRLHGWNNLDYQQDERDHKLSEDAFNLANNNPEQIEDFFDKCDISKEAAVRTLWLTNYVYTLLKPAQVVQQTAAVPKYKLFRSVKAERSGSHFPASFDLLTLHGYQLTAFACPVTPDLSEVASNDTQAIKQAREFIRLKVFETIHRVRQIGGSEARVVLVTFYRNSRELETEIREDLRDEDFNFEVIGPQKLKAGLPALKNEIFNKAGLI